MGSFYCHSGIDVSDATIESNVSDATIESKLGGQTSNGAKIPMDTGRLHLNNEHGLVQHITNDSFSFQNSNFSRF